MNHQPHAFSDEEKKVSLANLALFKALSPYVRPYAWMLALTTFLVFMVTGFELFQPWLIQQAIDGFILVSGDPGFNIMGFEIEQFSVFGLWFGVVILAGFILDFSQAMFMEYTGQKIMLNLRCRLFDHMTDLPVAYFDKNASGRLVARVAGDIENMNEMFTSVLVFIFRDLLLMAGVFAILFFTNHRLTFYLSLMIPIVFWGVVYFSGILRRVFRTLRQKNAEINHRFSEAISGIRAIQTSMAGPHFIHEFKRLNLAHFKAAMSHIRVFSVFMPMVGLMGTLAVAVILWNGSFMVQSQGLTLGELVAFLTYMKLFFRPLRELSEKFNLLQNALASAERIITVLNTPKARQDTKLRGADPGGIGHLAFENVSFSYTSGVPVLKHISFSLEKGKAMGIVGQTGAGKSTIINLTAGFYSPTGGRILINGQDYVHMDIAGIRHHTALVMQDPILFSGTVRENIVRLPDGDSRRDDQRLSAALRKANCSFLFDKFSGLDTILQDGGRPLSSGEKQLVCIARAFAFNPDLIIFDEATSYMDSQSEVKIHDAMKKLMEGRLSIIIAHRLSTVKSCDHILVLRDGQIIEQGGHEQLSRAGGEYARLLEKERM
ncbi:ABC transporter ATP-binding protein [Desulfobacter hydrogenophilus]|uniref:Multidrug resistance-like ATP-binding protein MdlB n=1 Tax=Desulfobacter hydrogenophilus TaxID=2291 RepID=A0A328FHT7_9BACT|nr:ABC transporter ATP-binding protein [Desulfobacter hydrogenophilus]NDY70953.1 ABC transporter ATP-binding protein [Desulfobacter hydrogenophilus]QBH12805.1 ABC transporter ATP-binding protein [Desulfobacter hydrogenophilus]RAM03042.1 ABC transporter ATP-binding protein [Desulfobacter hydrogenophilus]